MKITPKEIELLKGYFEGLVHCSRLAESEYQKLNQSPDFANKRINNILTALHENISAELLIQADFVFQVLDCMEREDLMEMEETLRNYEEETTGEDAA